EPKVLLPQRSNVPQLMPRDVECEAANRRCIAIYFAFALPSLSRQSRQQSDRRLAHGAVLVEQVSERASLEVGRRNVELLVEARQRERFSSGDAESAVGIDALVVREVSHDLLQRPFARRVSQTGDSLLGERLEKLQRRSRLRS